jgi:hypothetical protein
LNDAVGGIGAGGEVALVRFPHPGPEHNPGDRTFMEWNRGNHARKFLLAAGSWVEPTGETRVGDVTFWGEWEADSQIVARRSQPAVPDGPRWLHRALWPYRNPVGFHQNTDPLVFGGFTYSNCRQARNRKLRNLEVGSLVLFGSILRSRFVLDTCFVVGGGQPYRLHEPPDNIDLSRQRLVFDPLDTVDDPLAQPLVLYHGATKDQPVNGTHSFVPAAPYDPNGRWGFVRPAVEIPGVRPHRGAQAASTVYLTPIAAADAWEAVVEQVLDAGLLLAVHLEMPQQAPGKAPLGANTAPNRGRC